MWPRRSAADAHDAGAFGGSRPERFPADAHDAFGVFGGCGLDVVQLMLMMPGVWGVAA